MSLEKLDLKYSYISYGDNNLTKALIGPALRRSIVYKRSVGFFSSSVFENIRDDVIEFARSGGHIKLICGLQLSYEDKTAIENGYKLREDVIDLTSEQIFREQVDILSDENLLLLEQLIAKGILDIKLAITKGAGIYHDKLGIFQDALNNQVVFYGSPNSTGPAYSDNYEKVRVAVSWKEGFIEIVEDENKEFDRLWNEHNPYVDVYRFTEKAHKIVCERRDSKKKQRAKNSIILRDYQEEAINAWVNNNYHGFFVMATGTGKTWTAIYASKRLLDTHPAMIVICAPYKHLIKQWKEDVEKAYPSAKIFLVSSENPGWDNQITDAIISQKYYEDNQIIIISTIKSFQTERFDNVINKSTQDKLLIIDEAHRFKDLRTELKDSIYKFLLGLSATPGNGKNNEATEKLLSFFGGKVFSLPIEDALQKKYLVPYNYYPIFVHSTYEEESRFEDYSKKMASCFKDGVCIDPDSLAKYSRSRLRVIAMANGKIDNIDEIIDQINEPDHFVVYCGDGKLFDDNKKEEIRHINYVKSVLDSRDKKACQFTASEKMDKRMQLVDGFNRGEFDSLVAIRCLDEGINIPSIHGALILASNDDYREFVQRRGRILRLYPGKTHANIYDVIVLPSIECVGWAIIELRRFLEYAKLSMNWDSNYKTLNNFLDVYGLTLEEISIFTETEEEIDE